MDGWIPQIIKGGAIDANDPASAFAAKNPSAVPATVDPPEDWEKANRTLSGPRASKARWQPVYVHLAGEAGALQGNAAALLNHTGATVEPRTLYFSAEAKTFLEKLEQGASTVDPTNPNLWFFVYRPEDAAYTVLTDLKGTPLYSVEAVGTAIPTDDRDALLTPLTNSRESVDLVEAAAHKLPCATAIIDDQIGFLNSRFRRRSGPAGRGVTRIDRLALMGQPGFTKSKYAQVGVANPFDIDALINGHTWEHEGYEAAYPGGVRFDPPADYKTDMEDPRFRRPFAFQAGHGTHVMDLAAGFPIEDNRQDRPIFAVQLPRLAAAETSGARLDLFVLLAVIRILDWADTTYSVGGQPQPVPVVINISYGFLAGPKDGSGFLESEIARRLAWRSKHTAPSYAVIPAGNGFRDRTHARLELSPGETRSVSLRLQPQDRSTSFVEIWINSGDQLAFTLTPPTSPAPGAPPGSNLLHLDLGQAPCVTDGRLNGTTVLRAYLQDMGYNGLKTSAGRRRLVLAFCPTINHDAPALTVPAGRYELTLTNTGAMQAMVDIDVQRDDTPSTFPAYGRQAYLDDRHVDDEDPETFGRDMPDPLQSAVKREATLSAMATSADNHLLVVGAAFDRHAFEKPALYSASGAGLQRGGPDLAAVTEESRAHPGRLAAGLFSGSSAVFSGTSMAAPLVTRALVDNISAHLQADHGQQSFQLDLSALLAGGTVLASQDARLGHGVQPFAETKGRPARRVRA